MQSLDSLEVIGKLLKNVAVGPTEEKFRKCRLSNAKLKAAIAGQIILQPLSWPYAKTSVNQDDPHRCAGRFSGHAGPGLGAVRGWRYADPAPP